MIKLSVQDVVEARADWPGHLRRRKAEFAADQASDLTSSEDARHIADLGCFLSS
jgi:hypothetical protein